MAAPPSPHQAKGAPRSAVQSGARTAMIDTPCPQDGSASTNQIMGGNQSDQWELEAGRASGEINQSEALWAGPGDSSARAQRLRRPVKRRRRRRAEAAEMEPGYGGRCGAGRLCGAEASPGWWWLILVATSAPAPLPAGGGAGGGSATAGSATPAPRMRQRRR